MRRKTGDFGNGRRLCSEGVARRKPHYLSGQSVFCRTLGLFRISGPFSSFGPFLSSGPLLNSGLAGLQFLEAPARTGIEGLSDAVNCSTWVCRSWNYRASLAKLQGIIAQVKTGNARSGEPTRIVQRWSRIRLCSRGSYRASKCSDG